MEKWNNLNEIEQIDAIVLASHDKPAVIFKHSTTCGISNGVKHGIETDYSAIDGKVHFYYLDLLTYRPVSNMVAERLNVIHQSPQVIVLKDGEVIHHSSHHAIDVNKIAELIEG